MPTLYPVAGAKIYIGDAVTPPDDDVEVADFNAVVWVEVKGWLNMGELGDSANLISTDLISTARTTKQKGTKNAGSMQNTFARIEDDPGQLALIAAAGDNNNYPFRIQFADTPAGGSMPSERLFMGLVMSARDAGGGANTVKTLNATVEVNTNVVTVAPDV